MRKLLVLALALVAGGCASFDFRLGKAPAPAGVDQDVVQGYVCAGQEQEAELYVRLRGASEADVMERVERARKWAAGRPSECPCAKRKTCDPSAPPAGN